MRGHDEPLSLRDDRLIIRLARHDTPRRLERDAELVIEWGNQPTAPGEYDRF